ncbi:hypothetical protein [Paracraurococcus lichenis]|uniref:Uncharacterized protein n=1 Tax=Paracraurococcus lichenis TaxID=3064888 RepID=A0ABT9DVV5_9PROT|nr:hypothetical protein [Paracraurococcus sp. LOR1-02]MDO9708034.1 hypothetical protein [Paracraurococcus sp. LOR1-02]
MTPDEMRLYLTVGGAILGLIASGFGISRFITAEVERIIKNYLAKELGDKLQEINRTQQEIQAERQHLAELQTVLEETQKIASERAVALTIFTLESLPSISLTQQIPISLLKNLSYVLKADLRSKLTSAENVPQELLGWLAYGTAIQRLALDPLARDNVEDGPASVLGLLSDAQEIFAPDIVVQRNIKLRRIQAYRQMRRFAEARSVVDELRAGLAAGTSQAGNEWIVIVDLAAAIINIQEILSSPSARPQLLAEAVTSLREHFGRIYGWRALGQEIRLGAAGDRGVYGGRFADGSIAFYTAKALWLDGTRKGSRDNHDLLWEALDVAFDRYERIRRTETDPTVSAIYNFCVAFIIAMRLSQEIVGFGQPRRLEVEYGDLQQAQDWQALMEQCLRNASVAVQHIASRRLPNVNKSLEYIYSESSECLNAMGHFQTDIEIVRAMPAEPALFQNRFSGAWRAEAAA